MTLKTMIDVYKRQSHGLDGNKHYFEWKIESKLYTNYSKKFSISYLYASENDKRIKIVFFNDKFSPRSLKIGQTYKFYTKIVKNGYEIECHNPEFTDIDDDRIGNIVPIYPLTKSLTNKNLSDFIGQALEFFDENEVLLDKKVLDDFNFSDKLSNLKEIHFPTSLENLKSAKSQIKMCIRDRTQTMKKSELDNINGIGKRKKENLLKHFKSVKNIKKASLEELMEVDLIGESQALEIIKYFKLNN